MDLQHLQYLPAELKDRYAKLEAVFKQPGWALIVEFAKQRAEEARNRQLNAQTWDTALLNRGAAHAFGVLETLHEATENEFSAIAAAHAERAQVEDEIEHE